MRACPEICVSLFYRDIDIRTLFIGCPDGYLRLGSRLGGGFHRHLSVLDRDVLAVAADPFVCPHRPGGNNRQ